MVQLLHLAAAFVNNGLELVYDMRINGIEVRRTETTKITAPCSREISLHSIVSSGLPTGTYSYPGGGILLGVI